MQYLEYGLSWSLKIKPNAADYVKLMNMTFVIV